MAGACSLSNWSSQLLLHHQVGNFRIFYYNYFVCNNFITFSCLTLASQSTHSFETLLMKLSERYATFSIFFVFGRFFVWFIFALPGQNNPLRVGKVQKVFLSPYKLQNRVQNLIFIETYVQSVD